MITVYAKCIGGIPIHICLSSGISTAISRPTYVYPRYSICTAMSRPTCVYPSISRYILCYLSFDPFIQLQPGLHLSLLRYTVCTVQLFLGLHLYVVCLLNSRKTLIKIKQLKIEPRLFLAFFSVGPGDVHMFFPALSLSPERLSDVRRCAIFRTPSSSFREAC
jgi:hypothetical protein